MPTDEGYALLATSHARNPQAEVGIWHRATFGEDCPLSWIGNKLAAECGEVNEAILDDEGQRRREGRTYEDDLRAECADVLVVLYAIADRAGFDLGVAFQERFAEVSRRVFIP